MEWILCFVFGGLLCVIAQIVIDKTSLTPARILTAYVCIGVLLTALGIYQPLVEIFGFGATVPLTGFGYALARGVKEAVDAEGFLGIFLGGIQETAGGISAAIVFSLLISVFSRGKPENL